MRKWTIKTTTTSEGTMVWCLNDERAAIVIDVIKRGKEDFVTQYRNNTKIGFFTKASAVADAKKQLKRIILERQGL